MKIFLTLITFIALTISSTFATTTTNDILINGNVDEKSYSFGLTYDGVTLTNGATLTTQYNLAAVSNTNNFIVKRSAGNLKQLLRVTITVYSSSFVGLFKGNPAYDTGLYPQVNFISDYTYDSTEYNADKTAGEAQITIPAGPNTTETNIAGFNLNIKGNSSIPAGNFVSTVTVSYVHN